jgi:hypothetical protein
LKPILLLLVLLISSQLQAYQLHGHIKDQAGEPLSDVSVYLNNSTYGTVTDLKGNYILELKPGTYTVKFEFIGFVSKNIEVNIIGQNVRLNLRLNEDSKYLETVLVKGSSKDPAYGIVAKAVARREENWKRPKSYSSAVYIKASLENENISDSADEQVITKKNVNLVESWSIKYFKAPGQIKEVKKAYKDLTEKVVADGQSVNVGVNLDQNRRRGSAIQMNKYLFYTYVDQGNFDFYGNQLTLATLGDRPFVSPLSKFNTISYRFKFIESFLEGEHIIYKIRVIPKNAAGNLFRGIIYIEDESYALKAVDLEINSIALNFYNSFKVIQNYGRDSTGRWEIVRQEFLYHTKQGRKNKKIGKTTVLYTDFKYGIALSDKFMRRGVVTYEDDAYDKDSSYWSDIRPIGLKRIEQKFIRHQDSIENHLKSDAYLSKRDSIFNQFSWINIGFTGFGHRNYKKKQGILFNPLISSIRPLSVGGYRQAVGGNFYKTFEDETRLTVNYEVNYGINNKDLKGFVHPTYLYNPKKQSRFGVRLGNYYEMINDYQSIESIFSRSNYAQKILYGLTYRTEIVNGLYVNTELSFAEYRSISDILLSEWSDSIFGNQNRPIEFDDYRDVLVDIELEFVPFQKYIMKPKKKEVIGSDYPSLILHYRKGVKPLLNSSVDYDFLEFQIWDRIDFKTFGNSRYHLYVGSFLNNRDIRVMDEKFFRRSDRIFFSNPLRSFQLLGSIEPTTDNFFQGHYLHHFNGSIMNKIPYIKYLNLKAVAGSGLLLIDGADRYQHGEAYVGLERVIRIRHQLIKLSGFYVQSISSENSWDSTFKFGIDFYNSFTRLWSY